VAARCGEVRKKLTGLLRWENQWGGIASKWEEQYRATGKVPPDQYYQRPDLDEAEQSLLMAFYDLGTERQLGMSLGPIPRSKVREYAREELDLHGDHRDRFVAIISRVDNDYLSMIRSRNTADDGPPMRDMASPKDVEGTRRVLQNLGKKPASKQMKHNG